MIEKKLKLSCKILACFLVVALTSCKEKKQMQSLKEDKVNVVETASKQYNILYDSVQTKKGMKNYIPRSIKDGAIKYVNAYDWTSGFYAGTLWYLYNLSEDKTWKDRALEYTIKLDSVQYYTGNHDIGFMMECSFGRAIMFADKKEFEPIIVQSAKSLATRFREKAGIIQSWDAKVHFEEGMWACPVIIDNMMNLELLFHASKITGDSKYANIAISHANNTLKNHFREDYSSIML